MTIYLPDDVDERFRLACAKKFGLRRGKVNSGFRDGIILFIKSVEGDSYKELNLTAKTLGQNPYPDRIRVQKKRGRPRKSEAKSFTEIAQFPPPKLTEPPKLTHPPLLPHEPPVLTAHASAPKAEISSAPKQISSAPKQLEADYKSAYDHLGCDELQREYKKLQDSGDRQYDEKLSYIAKRITKLIYDNVQANKPLATIEPTEPQKNPDSAYY